MRPGLKGMLAVVLVVALLGGKGGAPNLISAEAPANAQPAEPLAPTAGPGDCDVGLSRWRRLPPPTSRPVLGSPALSLVGWKL